jgi:hypothetical protein
MATFTTKINPLHFPTLVTDFGTKTNAQVAHECFRDSARWIQMWSDSDVLTMYFSDSDGFFPLEGRLLDVVSGETFLIAPDANIGDDYWFEIDLAPYNGRELVFQAGRFIAAQFTVNHESEPFKVLPHTDSRVTECSTVMQYWGCSDDFGWNWNVEETSTVPVYVPTLRIFDSIRQRAPVIRKTVRETYDKSYFTCAAEADFLLAVRLEFSPLWWHEKLSLATVQREVRIDGARFVQELEVQPGEQYQNLPLFKGELLLKKADQVTLMRHGCC